MAVKKVFEIPEGISLLTVSGRVGGKRREVLSSSENHIGDTQEKIDTVKVTVTNRPQFDAANYLLNKGRAQLKRHGTCATFGFIADAANTAQFIARIESVMREVDAHNAEYMQEHTLDLTWDVLPISIALTSEHAQKLVTQVRGSLEKLTCHFRAGDIRKVAEWTSTQKRIGALVPALIRRAVDAGIETIPALLATLRAEVNDSHRDPLTVGPELDLNEIETAINMLLE